MRKLVLLPFLVTTMMTLVACGSGSSSSANNNRASLDTTYDALSRGDFNTALVQVNEALAKDEAIDSGQGLLLKSQTEQAIGNSSEAVRTLATYDKLFPQGSGDSFLFAQYESQKGDGGDPQIILENLVESLNDNYSGIDKDIWWAIVDESDEYAYFRTTTQFTTLESLKPDQSLVAAGGCKENYTAFKKPWYGPEIWVSHKDMIYFNAAEALYRFIIGLAIPFPTNELVKLGLWQRQALIKSREGIKGCGVVLYYTWLTFPSGQGFVVGTQK